MVKNYRGWQRQPNAPSVQKTLEDQLSIMLHQKTHCHPCGRTDAGVHADQFFAHIDIEQTLDFDPVFRLNKMLPDDIAIYNFIEVQPNANAQLDAQQRTYQYFIHQNKNPFLSDLSALYLMDLDVEKMRKACPLFTQYRDYKMLCLNPDIYKHTLCEVSQAHLEYNKAAHRFCFTISADRFLRAMIRMIVGRLIEIGTGQITIQQLENALQNFEALPYNSVAYPQGLHLVKVDYPYLDFDKSI